MMEFRKYGTEVQERLAVDFCGPDSVGWDEGDLCWLAEATGFDRDLPYQVGILTEPFGIHLAGAYVLQAPDAVYLQV